MANCSSSVLRLGSAFVAIVSVVLIASGSASAASYSGSLTAYGDGWQGGACLYKDLPAEAKKSFVAINQVLWDSMGMQQLCGRCVKITSGSRTVMGIVTNRCPECGEHDLDMADDLFTRATGSAPSRASASWELVDCDAEVGVSGEVAYYTKDGVNSNWLAVQPTNFKQPISKLSIEYPAGRMTEMTFGSGGLNYYLAAGLLISGPFTLHGTDVSGKTYSVTADGVKPSSFLSSGGSSSPPSSGEAKGPSPTAAPTPTTASSPTITPATTTNTEAVATTSSITSSATQAAETQASSAANTAAPAPTSKASDSAPSTVSEGSEPATSGNRPQDVAPFNPVEPSSVTFASSASSRASICMSAFIATALLAMVSLPIPL